MNTSHNPEDLKSLILISKEPLRFKRLLNSEILKWSLDDWADKLKNEVLEFRLGKFQHSAEPQWERKTAVIKSSFQYFLQCAKSEKPVTEETKWLYFDYKYLRNWFTNVMELKSNITWAPLGFPDITAEDCTIWIGTKGSHTPCHIDTYGCNLIYQVYGKKLWIVAPPDENLKPTRIPYEESSIYSKLNFFSPNTNDFKGISNCRKIILNPGDVLFLPPKWWHYVENLETAISINVWLPLKSYEYLNRRSHQPWTCFGSFKAHISTVQMKCTTEILTKIKPQDDEERLRESIVQLFVKQMVGLSNNETTDYILNPNMRQLIMNSNSSDMVEIINNCKRISKVRLESNKKFKTEKKSTESNYEISETEILDKYKFIEKVPKMSQEEFNLFLEQQSNRFKSTIVDNEVPVLEHDKLQLLSAFTDNDVISLISKKLFKENM